MNENKFVMQMIYLAVVIASIWIIIIITGCTKQEKLIQLGEPMVKGEVSK